MGRFLFGRTPSTAGFTFPNNRTQNFTIFCYRTRLYFLATRSANAATKTLASRAVCDGSSIALAGNAREANQFTQQKGHPDESN